MGEDRKGGLDLLKIVSLLLIIMMHISGPYYNDSIVSFGNKVFFAILNAIGNTGVSCFMLISGYFGLKLKFQRIAKLWLTILFFSIMSGIVQFLIFKDKIQLFRSFFPIISCKSWYFTCYFILLSVSSYIDKLINMLSKKQFIIMIILLLCWFSVFPTFFYFNITNDTGKGIANLFLVYLIGRYIRLYSVDKLLKQHICFRIFLITAFLITSLNLFFTLYYNQFKNFFAYDNSILIIFESVAVFILFLNININNRLISEFSKITPVAFFAEGSILFFLLKIINVGQFIDSALLPLTIFVVASLTLISSFILKILFDNLFLSFLYNLIINLKLKINNNFFIKWFLYEFK